MIAIEACDGDVLIVKTSGHLETAELDSVVDQVERALAERPKTHMLVEVAGFSGFDPAALPDYLPRALAMLGKLDRFGRIAVVADQQWVRAATRLESALIPGIRYEVFTPDERDQALAWVKGSAVLPHAPALRIIETDNPSVIGYELDGSLTAPELEIVADYFNETLNQPGPVRILGRIRNLTGFEPSAAVSGKYLGMKFAALGKVERYAVVGGPDWLHGWIGAIAPLLKTEMRCFDPENEAEAWAWLGARPGEERALAV